MDAVTDLELGRWISRHPVILHPISNSRHLIPSLYSRFLAGLVMAGALSSHNALLSELYHRVEKIEAICIVRAAFRPLPQKMEKLGNQVVLCGS